MNKRIAIKYKPAPKIKSEPLKRITIVFFIANILFLSFNLYVLYFQNPQFNVPIPSNNPQPTNIKTNTISAPKTIITKDTLSNSISAETVTLPKLTLKTIEHTVEEGQTLYSISRQYGISIDSLKKNNSLLNNTIVVGTTLKIGVTNQ